MMVSVSKHWMLFGPLLLTIVACPSNPGTTVPVHKLIQIGMERNDVENVLQEQRVEFGWYPSDQTIKAINRDVARNGVVTANQQIIVTFDQSGKVVDVSTKEIFTGP
jgi:hypothetical protein